MFTLIKNVRDFIMNFGQGVDVFKLAEDKGIAILSDAPLTDNVRGAVFQKDGAWYILINPYDTPERQCFTIAHELAEIELNERTDLSPDEKHRMANVKAGEILLPAKIFQPVAYHHTLIELKDMFPACSFEVIARRLLVFRQAVLTIMDNRMLTLRTASCGIRYPKCPVKAESSVISECYERKKMISRTCENLEMDAYFIDKNVQIERVILFTIVRDDFS